MIFNYVLILFMQILNILTVPLNYEKPCHKINVVLFFSKSSCHTPKEAAGVKALEMHEVAMVKPNFPIAHNTESHVPKSPTCKDLLQESLTSLVHYCENALGMKAAVSAVSSSEITNFIKNAESETPEIREEHLFNSQNVPRDIFHGHPGQGPKWNMVNAKDVITSPEHTEVFKIRMKRQMNELQNEVPGEIVDVPLEKESKKPVWDVLDVMSHIKFSFFGKLFENEAKEKLTEEENRIANELTQTKDPGLFETVKTTLCTLQENPEEPFLMVIFGGRLSEISNTESPLIQTIKHVIENTDPTKTLIVLSGACPEHDHKHLRGFGHGHEHHVHHNHEHGLGHEAELDHEHKCFLSHQHGHECFHENRHKRKREFHYEEDVVRIEENNYGLHHENTTIPVFARGPEYTKLSQCSLLFDVPIVVKTILEQMAPSFEGGTRSKRSIFGDIRMNRENLKNIANRNGFQTVIFSLCVFVLFIK